MFIEAVKLIGLLLAIIVMYVISGIVNNVLVKGQDFEFKRLIVGITKAVVACASLIVLAYLSSTDLIDLSTIGFQPKTFVSSGIIFYGSKLLSNITSLIGINKDASASELALSSNTIVSNLYDKLLGKVCIEKEDKCEYNNEEVNTQCSKECVCDEDKENETDCFEDIQIEEDECRCGSEDAVG